LNFIHPTFVNKNKIKLKEVKRSFNVTGLGYGISTIYEQTEKCILRFKNHFEVIQLYALYIPDVDIILGIPWIEKYCPINYHDSRKISFPSGYCARNCNNGKRKRKNKNRSNKGSKKCKIDIEPVEEIPMNQVFQISVNLFGIPNQKTKLNTSVEEELEPLMIVIVIVIVLILVLKIMIVVKKKLTFVILKNLVQ